MADLSRIIAPSPEELEAIKAACERAGLAMGWSVTQVEIDQILDLLGLKQLPQTQRMEARPMADISPAAQAVLKAANGVSSYGPEDILNYAPFIAAAALRAAAEQLRAKGLFLDLSPMDRQMLQRDVDEVIRLHQRGILKREEAEKACERITIEIAKHVRKTTGFNA